MTAQSGIDHTGAMMALTDAVTTSRSTALSDASGKDRPRLHASPALGSGSTEPIARSAAGRTRRPIGG